MIPNILIEIKEYLIREKYDLSTNFLDGRTNSAINENLVLSLIKQKYNGIIKTPKIRDWYDFAIETDKYFYPVNIKITDTTHADNLNCKLGIYYIPYIKGINDILNIGYSDFDEYIKDYFNRDISYLIPESMLDNKIKNNKFIIGDICDI
jgi:hypothetical protein